jgi:cyclic di-GMP phosphodiesterase
VFDALISRRIYKRAFTHEEAVAHIVEERGTHFDPDVIDAFLGIEKEFRQIAERYQDPVSES